MGRIVRHSDNVELPQEILIEPVPVNNPGVYVARAVSEIYKRNGLEFVAMRGLPQEEVERENIGSVVAVTTSLEEVQAGTQRAQRDKEKSDPRYCLIEVINTSVDTIEIGKNVKLGDGESLEPVTGLVTERHGYVHTMKVSRDNGTDVSESTQNKRTGRKSSRIQMSKDIESKISHLSDAERVVLKPVLKEYYDLFLYDEEGKLPCTNKGFNEIKTDDAMPIKKNPYRVPFALRGEMHKQLNDMIQKEVITPAFSEWAAPVILVNKKSMDGTPKYRFCTDFRGLNAVTKIPVYPIPDIKSNLSLMAGSRYFTLLDIESAYWHIPIHPDDKNKTGFITPFGNFCYERLAYGLAGTPSTFQKIMDITLMGLKDISALVYLDDILIFSDTIQEHAKRIKNVFDRIREANFKSNLEKCTFAAREVAYLGHIVSADGIMVDQGKVKAIKQFPLPKTVRDVRAFLGLAGYYRSFIKDFANLSKPLTLLTRKDTKFYWSELQQKAFDALKAALTSESLLAHPEFDKTFILSCDASNYAISAILSQDHNGKERPLSFASRVLNQHEINYSTTEKELLAVVFGVRTQVFSVWKEIQNYYRSRSVKMVDYCKESPMRKVKSLVFETGRI